MSQIVAIKPKAITFDSKGSYSYNSSESYPLFPTKCEIIMQVNGAWSLSLEVPFDTNLNDYIVEEGIIGVTIRDSLTKSIGLSNEQTFRIEKVQRTQYLITVDAYQTFLDCEQYMLSEHMHVVEKNAVYAISQLLARADEPFAYDVESSDTTLATAYWEWKNIMECLNGDEDNSFLNRWGGEFLLDNHKIIWKRKIDRFQNSPKEELIRISAGVNMTNIQYTIDTSQLVTEIWAQAYNGRHYGKVISAEKDPEDEKKTNYIIDYKSLRSNHFNEYSIAYTSNVTYDKIKLKEDAGESEEENITVCETYDDLNAALEKAVQNDFEENKIDIPAITYDVDFTDLTSLTKYKGYDDLITLCLGDSCQVYNDDLQIETVARVQQITYDVVNEIVTKMTLGDYTIDYFRTQADYNRTIQKVLDIDNGGVKAETINGVIDGQKAQLISSLDVSNQNSTRILKTENTKIGEDFGALAFGSDGVQATTEYLEDGNGWNWEDSTLFNQKGIWYGKVGNQEDTKYISVDKAGLQSYDGGVSGQGVTGTITVDSFSTVNGVVVGKSDWSPITYKISLSGDLLVLTDSNGNSSSVNLPQEKTVEFHDGNGIASVKLNDDYTLTLTFDDETSYTTKSIRGAQGIQGIQGTQGDKGDKGDKGDPLTITKYDIAYQESESPTVMPTGQWLEKPVDVLQGNYLWCRIKQDFSDGTSQTYYSVSRFGADGAGGQKGDTGTGISEIKHYYLASGLDSGVTIDTSGWTETIQQTDDTKKYLWRYDVTIWSDGKKTYTTPCIYSIKAQDGSKGDPGEPGEDGKTSYSHFAYANSSDGKIGFSTTVSNGKTYIGIYTDFVEADSTNPSDYRWSLIKGETGNGIVGIVQHYAKSDSETTAPTRWSNTIQQPDATNKYIWYYETIQYSDDTTWDSTPRIIDRFAEGFSDITPYYNLSTSKDEFVSIDGYTWSKTIPEILTDTYLFQKFIITKSDGTTKELDPVAYTSFNDLIDKSNTLSNSITQIKTDLDIKNDSITSAVHSIYEIKNDLDTYKQSNESKIEQTNKSITTTIKKLTEVETNTDYALKSITEVSGYMRYDGDKLELGKSDNSFKTELSNTEMAFVQNGEKVSYFSNNKQYVTNGEFTNTLQIGKFAFVPRANGSLDFKKAGE